MDWRCSVSIITIIGIDPGLVHTGVVMIKIDTIKNIHRVEHKIVESDNPAETAAWVRRHDASNQAYIYIEKYLDRGTVFNTHSRMRAFEQELKRALPVAKLVDNTGAKKIVTRELMELLDVWKFPTTNHRDLQAAARIALFGALKDTGLNRALYNLTTTLLERSTP